MRHAHAAAMHHFAATSCRDEQCLLTLTHVLAVVSQRHEAAPLGQGPA